jgi:hypothetical protein
MKYLVLNVYNKEDYPKISEKGKQLTEEREKYPDKYPPHIFPPHTITGGLGEAKAIAIVEATEEQIMNELLFWRPINQLEFYPLVDSRELGRRFSEKQAKEE